MMKIIYYIVYSLNWTVWCAQLDWTLDDLEHWPELRDGDKSRLQPALSLKVHVG